MSVKESKDVVETLRKAPFFAGLPEPDLTRLVEMSEIVSVPEGEVVIEEGSIGDAAYVVLEGELEVSKRAWQQEMVISVRLPGELLGEMSLLEQVPRTASVRVSKDSRLLRIPKEAFDQFLYCSPAVALTLLRTVTARLRENEAVMHQTEKMAALGTLTAGLAHELNNPAAAAQRNAAQLHDALTSWQYMTLEISNLSLEPNQVEVFNALHETLIVHTDSSVTMDPLARADGESEVEGWLEERGVDKAWELAPALFSSGWDVKGLEKLTEVFSAEQIPFVVKWMAAGCTVYSLLNGVYQSAGRIYEIVKAVKAYSYLDQAPIQEIDVHEGLENTLIILSHKLKTGVNVIRQYAPDLPRIDAHGSDLNQVWTNIIDNAIDAMQGQGDLILRTASKDGHVVVEIQDSGPGIPPEIQSRIFDPFFTTKPPGSGSGLGLNIAYDIVVNKHHGEIHLTSQPGATCFQIVLPIHLEENKL
jgi:signal transduction histidine kinase